MTESAVTLAALAWLESLVVYRVNLRMSLAARPITNEGCGLFLKTWNR